MDIWDVIIDALLLNNPFVFLQKTSSQLLVKGVWRHKTVLFTGNIVVLVFQLYYAQQAEI